MSSLLGIHLTFLIGETVPTPAPISLLEALESVEVTHSDEGRSGFQLTFRMDRGSSTDFLDFPLLSEGLVQPGSRIVLVVTFGAAPSVLIDGIITHHQLQGLGSPKAATLIVTGEDLTVLMDREEKDLTHPAQGQADIVRDVLWEYFQYGIVGDVTDPDAETRPDEDEWSPTQSGTDYQYMEAMASDSGFVFYLIPGPAPASSIAYWGPPTREGTSQPALTVGFGSDRNVESFDIQFDALAPTTVTGSVQSRDSNDASEVSIDSSSRSGLSSDPASSGPLARITRLRLSSADATQAEAKAQSLVDQAAEQAVTVTGTLNALTYGALLEARALVDVRGVGHSFDGTYFVKKVTHTIERGSYKQAFTIIRDGIGATSTMVEVA